MALHRDIYWVGRQWAVTGYGMQAVDPKLKGQFDIEAIRLWEDGLSDNLNAAGWLNSEDFAKALSVARARYPQASLTATPPEPPLESVLRVEDSAAVEPPKPQVPRFAMRIERWPAKFLRPWRTRLPR